MSILGKPIVDGRTVAVVVLEGDVSSPKCSALIRASFSALIAASERVLTADLFLPGVLTNSTKSLSRELA